MHVLIVHAHPEPRSFGAALVRQAQQTLSAVDATVTVSDLYAMNWEPRSARRNFTTILDPGVFRQQAEEQFASDHHGFGPDIAAELTKLQACDLLILQFPLWWFAMPAILKGWVDRGDFRGRRAMLCLTTGGPTSMYSPDGLNGDMSMLLYPIQQGILQFTGFDVLEPFVAWAPAHRGDVERTLLLARWRDRLRGLQSEEFLPPTRIDDHDPVTFRRRS